MAVNVSNFSISCVDNLCALSIITKSLPYFNLANGILISCSYLKLNPATVSPIGSLTRLIARLINPVASRFKPSAISLACNLLGANTLTVLPFFSAVFKTSVKNFLLAKLVCSIITALSLDAKTSFTNLFLIAEVLLNLNAVPKSLAAFACSKVLLCAFKESFVVNKFLFLSISIKLSALIN